MRIQNNFSLNFQAKNKKPRNKSIELAQEKIKKQQTKKQFKFPKINEPDEVLLFDEQMRQGVKLSQQRVLLQPKRKASYCVIGPIKNEKDETTGYVVATINPKNKEVRSFCTSEKSLLNDERYCAGTIKKLDKDSYDIIYYANGMSGYFHKATKKDCIETIRRENLTF